MAEAKVDVDPTFRKLLEKLVTYNAMLRDSALQPGSMTLWFHPKTGVDTLKLEDISEHFSREELSTKFREVVAPTGGGEPGVVGDLISILAQGDYMATAERAYRNRHSTSARLRMHAAARAKGHAHASGVLQLGAMRYIQGINQRGRS